MASQWFQKYQPLDDETASAFVETGVNYGRQLLGEPRLPVQKVYLRRSTPLDPSSNIKRDFQLCEITDREHGIFTIYLSATPADYRFYGQLAHEIAHLLNAELFDMYVEGLNTVFAERLLKVEGKDWSRWETYLANDDRFYGTSYAMMREVWDAVGAEHIKTFLSFAVSSDLTHAKMHIDIDGWIASLLPTLQPRVRTIIAQHSAAVAKAMKQNSGLAFLQPGNI